MLDEARVTNPVSFDFGRPFNVNLRTDLKDMKDKLIRFLNDFAENTFHHKYRTQMKENFGNNQYFVDVCLEDLSSFDITICGLIMDEPHEYLHVLDEAARIVGLDVRNELPENLRHGPMPELQVMIHTEGVPDSMRKLKAQQVSRIVKVPGMIIAATGVKSKCKSLTLQCRSCGNTIPKIEIKPGLEGYTLPRRCLSEIAGQAQCPLDPYMIRTTSCECVDFQLIKMQELSDAVPHGELPRHVELYCDGHLCDMVAPGNKVAVVGVYSIKKRRAKNKKDKKVGVRTPYIRVLGFTVDNQGLGRTCNVAFTPHEIDFLTKMTSSPAIYDRITKSIAPSIFGFEDVKKAIACLMFGGSRKRLPDNLMRRGDINILLLGDPGTAKSQLLKFVECVSPIGVYTSGKGSSAAGLTASVAKDPHTRNFVIEGGAMVLADGGIVCIDEFDKMREDDRVAIHEAMEQQTISIAKAGITTTLNSRCSVLAAANSVFGRWDELKGSANINFMPTILSRFDMIFIIKDRHNEARDITLAKHVLNVHVRAEEITGEEPDGELSVQTMRKLINFCRRRCGPRLSAKAGDKLKTQYVLMRTGTNKHNVESSSKSVKIPITVRQLEAIIRISESLAKMELAAFATDKHVDEALRLFTVSTLDAALSGKLAGSAEFTSCGDYETMLVIEKQLKRRFPVGIQVTESTIIQDFTRQDFPESCVKTVLNTLLVRGDFVHRFQRKFVLRVK